MNNENINLKNKINNLENENEYLKNKLKNLEIEKENLKNENDNLKKVNNELSLKLVNIQNHIKSTSQSFNAKQKFQNVNDKNKIIELLNEKLQMKEKEIKDLKNKLFKFSNSYNINNFMTVIFYSTELNIHYSLICKETDIFSDIEKRLYKAYPECQDSEYFFVANEQKIKRFKSLQENRIKNSQIITIIQCDE